MTKSKWYYSILYSKRKPNFLTNQLVEEGGGFPVVFLSLIFRLSKLGILFTSRKTVHVVCIIMTPTPSGWAVAGSNPGSSKEG